MSQDKATKSSVRGAANGSLAAALQTDGTSSATAPPPLPSATSPAGSKALPPALPLPPTAGNSPPPPPLPAKSAAAETKVLSAAPAKASKPTPTAPKAETANVADVASDDDTPARREARRRPAGPSRDRIAANDDAPSIGGLIYALNQKPSGKPFYYATIATGVWVALCIGFGTVQATSGFTQGLSIVEILKSPLLLPFAATLLGPIALAFLLALLAWRTEELHLRSMAMTEVAVRLAEPDRMAEQHVASLGQNVRRQVSFMNDAVERALGRAGELEAMVHNEVASLERSYEDNERRIRGLLNELAGERHALTSTGDHFQSTLRALSSEVPGLIENLTSQQIKLSQLVDSASHNLTQLETALATQTGRLENTMSDNAVRLQSFFEGYTQALAVALGTRADEIRTLLGQSVTALDQTLDAKGEAIQTVLAGYTEALGGALEHRTGQMRMLLTDGSKRLEIEGEAFVGEIRDVLENQSGRIAVQSDAFVRQIDDRAGMFQSVFEEYGIALDTTLANRAEDLDLRILERTRALEAAFSDRLEAFDAAVLRSTMAIDETVGESSRMLTGALENHAKNLSQTMRQQSAEIDETLMQGVGAVRRTSENISRQSLKAIEGLASQAEMLKSVSENLLTQIHGVTNRFENQGQSIMRSANALESANHRIDQTLQRRAGELNETLQTLAGRADELGKIVQDYSVTLDGSLSEAETRARQITQELQRGTEERSQASLAEFSRFHQRLEGSMSEAESRARLITQDLSRSTDERSQAALADLGRFQQTLEGSLTTAHERARTLSEELQRQTQERSQATLAELTRIKQEARLEADRTLEELRGEFGKVSREISERLGSIGSEFTTASAELKAQAGRAAAELQQDQARLRDQLDKLPGATRESAEAMRRALQDQLRALDQLTQLSRRAAAERDVAQPAIGYQTARLTGEPVTQPPRSEAPRSASPQSDAPRTERTQPPEQRPARTEQPIAGDERSRALSSLTSTLQRELTQRQSGREPGRETSRDTGRAAAPQRATPVPQPSPASAPIAHAPVTHTPAGPSSVGGGQPPVTTQTFPAAPYATPAVHAQPQAQPAQPQAPLTQPQAQPHAQPQLLAQAQSGAADRDSWRFGDLLQRASREEARPAAQQPAPQPAPEATGQQPRATTQSAAPFDLAAAARAMDPATAAAVWARHRAGQRNFMVRSIYPEPARQLYDTAVARYRSDAGFRQNIAQFMGEFERMLADCDARDPTGATAAQQVTTDTGRVYLFLAHACGQLG